MKGILLLSFVCLVSCASVPENNETENSPIQTTRPSQLFEVREVIGGFSKVKVINNGLRNQSNKAGFPWNLQIVIELDEPNRDGSPKPQEDAYLNQFQTFVEQMLGQIGEYQYVGKLTWEGERRIDYYIAEPTIVSKFLTSMIDAKKITNNTSFNIEKDENWENYAKFFSN